MFLELIHSYHVKDQHSTCSQILQKGMKSSQFPPSLGKDTATLDAMDSYK